MPSSHLTNPTDDLQLPLRSRWLILSLGILGITAVKAFLATSLDLYSDEIFYWQASTRPALAYSDLPFMTSQLVGLGSTLLPGSTLAARSVFLLMGASLPLLVYYLARCYVSKLHALEAAILSLCLPLGAFLGLLAVPDVPLVFFGLLSLALFQRALASNGLLYWLATGLIVALGLSTHYRFVLYPLGVLIFLTSYDSQRNQWLNPRLWMTMLIASCGLIPILWFNFSYDAGSAAFYLVERHPWSFQATGLLHPLKQSVLVTPPLYVALGFCLWRMWKKSIEHTPALGLLVCVSLSNLSVYLLLAPWTDSTSTSIHWPLSGYFPLLIFLPLVLRDWKRWLGKNMPRLNAVRWTIALPIIGFGGSLTALTGVGSQAYQHQLQAILGPGVLSNKMAGWREFSAHTEELVHRLLPLGMDPVIITDNYYTAAQTEFALPQADVLSLDIDKAQRDGRYRQYVIWQRDEEGLRTREGRAALYISEDSTMSVPQRIDYLRRLCKRVGQLTYVDQLDLFSGDKTFSYYLADELRSPALSEQSSSVTTSACPFPPLGWIDQPVDGQRTDSGFTLSGWVVNEDVGVSKLALMINGLLVSELDRSVERPDVIEAVAVRSDPAGARVGFSSEISGDFLSQGENTVELRIVTGAGETISYGRRTLVKE